MKKLSYKAYWILVLVIMAESSIAQAGTVEKLNIDGIHLSSTIPELKKVLIGGDWSTKYLTINKKKYYKFIESKSYYESHNNNPVIFGAELTGDNKITKFYKEKQFGDVKPNWAFLRSKIITKYGDPTAQAEWGMYINNDDIKTMCWGDCYKESESSYPVHGSIAKCKSKGQCLTVMYSYTDSERKYKLYLELRNRKEESRYYSHMRDIENRIKSKIANNMDF